ncbi:MAG: ABC transporter permease [Deltaproteobacteria bacterium]|jgi:ABC-2 type transport system permease protein
MNIRRVKALYKKEFLQMLRDTRSLLAAIFIPILMIFLFGYALSLDVDQIPTLVFDQDQTAFSRELIHRLGDSRYFEIVGAIDEEKEIDRALNRDHALMALVIAEGFARQAKQGRKAPVQAIFNGSDANTAAIAVGYLKGVTTQFDLAVQKKRIRRAGLTMAVMPVELRTRVWFNPELKSRYFIIPGLTAVIMMAICSLLTALTVARERETKTLEQLISTPITSGELMLGKLLPYMGVGILDMLLVVGFGVFVFGVPFRGNVAELFLVAVIFLVGTLSWGLFLSVVSKTQLQASQMSIVTVFLPSFLLSGFIYPIENMPIALQAVTYLIPARYFVSILKGMFLKGIGVAYLWPEILALVAYAILVFSLARKKFTKRLL